MDRDARRWIGRLARNFPENGVKFALRTPAAASGFATEIVAMRMTMAAKHRREGREEGREEGQLKTKRADVISLLSERFGELTPDVVTRIEAEKDLGILDRWFKRGISARNLKQVGIA